MNEVSQTQIDCGKLILCGCDDSFNFAILWLPFLSFELFGSLHCVKSIFPPWEYCAELLLEIPMRQVVKWITKV